MKLDQTELGNSKSTNFLTLFNRRFESFFAEPKLRNVFAAQYSTWWSKFRHSFIEENWDVGDGSKTAWDVIQEVTNFSPGYIAAVVPHDLEATLFFGRPEQPYSWTEGLKDPAIKYEQARSTNFIRNLTAISVDEKDVEARLTGLNSHRMVTGHDGSGTPSLPVLDPTNGKRGPLGNVNADILLRNATVYPFWTNFLRAVIESGQGLLFSGNLATRNSNGDIVLTDSSVKGARALADLLSKLEKIRAGNVLQEIYQLIGDEAWPAIVDKLFEFFTEKAFEVDLPDNLARTFSLQNTINNLGRFEKAHLEGTLTNAWNPVRLILRTVPDPVLFLNSVYDSSVPAGHLRFTRAVDQQRDNWAEAKFNPVGTENMIEILTSLRAVLPVYLEAVRNFLLDSPFAQLAEKFLVPSPEKYPLNPQKKPFRDYHLVSSVDDMIENQMSATRSAMWNGVAISSGGDRPLFLWGDDGLLKGDRILRYFHEPNADLDILGSTSENAKGNLVNNKYLVGITRLAQGMRFMYRGQIVLRGRPEIKPWDIVYVYDHYNGISGPIEVERVTHHFSSQTGFVTTITPHAVVIPNDQVDTSAVMAMGIRNGVVASGIVLGAAVLGTAIVGALTGGIGLLALGLGLGAGAAGKQLADFALVETTDTDIVGNFIGVGRHGSLRMPVKIIPLSRQGAPWVAALRGFGRGETDDIGFVFEGVWKRGTKRIVDAGSALARIWASYHQGVDAYKDIERQWRRANQR
jgi:hypothetical protein